MRKTLLALFLALSLTLGLAACRQHPSTGGQTRPPQTAPLGEHTPNRSQRRRPGGLFLRHRQHGRGGPTAGRPPLCDLYAITPAEPYTEEDLDYTNPNSRSQVEGSNPDARPALAGEAWTSQVTIPSSWAIPSGMGRPPSSSPPSWKPMTAPAKPSSPSAPPAAAPSAPVRKPSKPWPPGPTGWRDSGLPLTPAQDTLSAWVEGLPLE